MIKGALFQRCIYTYIILQEQESRLGAMRKRAREKDSVEEEEEERGGRRERGRKEKREECSVTDASGHINFFTDLQKGVRMTHPTAKSS